MTAYPLVPESTNSPRRVSRPALRVLGVLSMAFAIGFAMPTARAEAQTGVMIRESFMVW